MKASPPFIRPRRCLVQVWLAALGMGVFSSPSYAETYALIVGIDTYQALPNLYGAVNDARDLSAVLERVPDAEVQLLLDEAASRDAIAAGMKEIASKIAEGDLFVFSFSGHGQQEPERVLGNEADGLDEVLMLSDFATSGKGTRERIFDDEIYHWVAEITRQGARALIVIDSCHSGTAYRSVDLRAESPSYRLGPAYTITDDELEVAVAAQSDMDTFDLPRAVFLAAGQDNERIPEIAIDGLRGKRGALSYLVARALEGAADFDGNGTLWRSELFSYVGNGVPLLAGHRQTPNMMPNDAADLALVGDVVPEIVATPPAGRLRVAAIGVDRAVAADLVGTFESADLVGVDESPDIVWDAGRGEVVSRIGDIVAYDVDARALGSVVEKWHAVGALTEMAISRPMSIALSPGNQVHGSGQLLKIDIERLAYDNLILFDLSSLGIIHFLYPLVNETTRVEEGAYGVPLKVTKPFGADHLIAIATPTRLPGLEAALRKLDGQAAADGIVTLLTSHLFGDHQLGIHALFTAPGGS